MDTKLKSFLRPLARKVIRLGVDPKAISSLQFYPRYLKERRAWIKKGGKIKENYMILSDYADSAGTAKGHYFHQDLLVSQLINKHKPIRHIDIASRIDGFVAHVASYRTIEVLDIRPLKESEHENIKFVQADLMDPQDLGQTDSLSCLHSIEHFGLGRYSDQIDIDGHNKGIMNLVNLVSTGGRLYISFPIWQADEVHFNAHRVFHPETILKHQSIKECMKLIRFDFVDDFGDLHSDSSINDFDKNIKFGCGIYTFQKY